MKNLKLSLTRPEVGPVKNLMSANGDKFAIMKKALYCLSFALCFSGCKKDTAVSEAPVEQSSSKSESGNTSATPDFTIAVIPDAQYYTEPDAPGHLGGVVDMLRDQITWIKANR